MKKMLLLSLAVFLVFGLAALENLVERYVDSEGRLVDRVVVPGIPEHLREPGPVAQLTRASVVLSEVPAFDWCYGCSATAAAMMAGYYDRKNYLRMYTGPTNGGKMPLNNGSWGSGECPLSATQQGYDGLTTQGHVNRFWRGSGQSGNDPFGSGNPTGTYADCTADFMGTNQDWWGNIDGGTTFYNYTNGSAIHDYSDCENDTPRGRDGTHGLRLFFESRGYTVIQNYNQYIYGHVDTGFGFTLDQYKAEINAGRPVIIQISGHSMLGVGYESTSNTIYVHDTWDHQMHSMQWGGSYSGMQHYGVGVIELAPAPTYTISGNVRRPNLQYPQSAVSGATITASGGYSTTTGTLGGYTLTVPYWWSGTIAASKADYAMDPGFISLSNVSSNQSDKSFSAWYIPYAPKNLTIEKLDAFGFIPERIKLSWDAYGLGNYNVYASPYPDSWIWINVSNQGSFSQTGSRVSWVGPIMNDRNYFYFVKVSY
ncbi:MAG: hypothetical protein GXY81_03145 [Candidatus Cloacimonetes bacterium]|nr:hypothetical protein [Candidatus Cloacimonadota bacterium]